MGCGKQIGTRKAAERGKPGCCRPNYAQALVGVSLHVKGEQLPMRCMSG
jgi:hypothetical protein